MEQANSRLRKTFHYPTDGDSDDDLPEALDEEEQETLIHTLQNQNQLTNQTYTRILLSVPLASALPYLRTIASPHLTLLSILSITSLLSTAWLLYTLHPSHTGLPFLDRLINSSSSSPKTHPRKQREIFRSLGISEGPIITYLPYLNLGLCVVLVGLGAVVERRYEVWWGFGWLPGLVLAVVVLAKWIMGGVDPEGELAGLRYGFKGA